MPVCLTDSLEKRNQALVWINEWSAEITHDIWARLQETLLAEDSPTSVNAVSWFSSGCPWCADPSFWRTTPNWASCAFAQLAGLGRSCYAGVFETRGVSGGSENISLRWRGLAMRGSGCLTHTAAAQSEMVRERETERDKRHCAGETHDLSLLRNTDLSTSSLLLLAQSVSVYTLSCVRTSPCGSGHSSDTSDSSRTSKWVSRKQPEPLRESDWILSPASSQPDLTSFLRMQAQCYCLCVWCVILVTCRD